MIMSIKLKKLARKFKIILAGYSYDPILLDDPFYYADPKNPMNGYFRFEVTEEMNELIESILHSLMSVRREIDSFFKQVSPRTIAGITAARVLNQLDRIEEIIIDENAFESASPGGVADLKLMDAHSISNFLIDELYKYRDEGKIKFNESIIFDLREVIKNISLLETLARRQSPLLTDNQLLMKQEDRDVDQINPEEMHVDFQYESHPDADDEGSDSEIASPYSYSIIEKEPASVQSSEFGHDLLPEPGKTFHAR